MAKRSGPNLRLYETSLTDLGSFLASLAGTLAEVLPGIADHGARETLGHCVEGMRRINASLRTIDALYDPEHAKRVTKYGRALQRLALRMGQSVTEVARASKRAAATLHDHVADLARIADASSGGDAAERLNATLARVRGMASEMDAALSDITSEAARTAEGLSALERELAEVCEKALLDALTRVHSRSSLDERLEAATAAGEANGPWCVLLVEVDGFQRVVEAHGQIIAEALLYKMARTLERLMPREEGGAFLARYAGEAFCLILLGTDLAQAAKVADTLRSGVAAARWRPRESRGETVVRTTVSVAVAQYRPGDTVSDLLERAHRALREAEGGNRVADP